MTMKPISSLPHTLSALAAAFLLAACSGGNETPPAPPVVSDGERVMLSEADKAGFLKLANVERDTGDILRLPGRLVWNEEKTVRVFPQLGGRVQRLAVDVGQAVKAGQTLATLSSGDYGQAQADAHRAQADLQLARQALARSSELREAGIVAEKDWQEAQADAARATAEANRAGKRLAALGGDGDGTYALKSPLAGVVVERNLNPGMEFRPDQAQAPLFVVTDPTSLWLQLDAGEADLPRLKAGEAIQLEVKHYPGERFKGVIRHVADFVDPASRTVKVRCEVPNADRRLKGEMFAQALIELPAGDALRVPAGAVMLLGEQRYVLVAEGQGRYRRQRVEVGAERDGQVDILGGLQVGQQVVSEGNLHLMKYLKAPQAAAK